MKSKSKHVKTQDAALIKQGGAAALLGQQTSHITYDQIRRRAHELFVARGGTDGHELDDWLQAEREVKAEMDRILRTHK
jgi:predicted phosphodiesterase